MSLPNSPNVSYFYELPFEVRDYEVDMFGVVNHAVYAHYFEHTRHSFLLSQNLPISQLRDQGWNPVVTQMNVSYKRSLLSGDHFVSKLGVQKITKVRFVFEQALCRRASQEVLTTATVTGTILNPDGRPQLPDTFIQALKPLVTNFIK